MSLILLEAGGALVLLVLIVWWTMFCGRSRGELPQATPPADASAADSPTSADKP